MQLCKHADLIAQYGQDCLKYERPWQKWQWKEARHWEDCSFHPLWKESCEYKRLPDTITVNGAEIVAPMKETPEKGAKYWTIYSLGADGVCEFSWFGSINDFVAFHYGIWSTEADAALAFEVMVAKPLRQAMKGGRRE